MVAASLEMPGANSPGGAVALTIGGSSSISAPPARRRPPRIGVLGEHAGHRLADVAHELAREDRLAVGLQPRDPGHAEIDRRHLGDIGAGPHRDHARRAERRADVDGAQSAVGHRRAHDAHGELVRE